MHANLSKIDSGRGLEATWEPPLKQGASKASCLMILAPFWDPLWDQFGFILTICFVCFCNGLASIWAPKRPPKWDPKGRPKAPSLGPISKNWWFSGFDFDPLLGLILEVFWEPKWRPKPSKSHLRKTSKKYAQNEPKVVPKGIPKWSQNHQKWGLGSILFQGWLSSGLQTPFRIDFGALFERIWVPVLNVF